MNRRLAIAAGLIGGAAALVVGTLLGNAVTGDQPRQGPARLVPVAGPGPDPGHGAEVASLPVFPPVQAAIDPDHDLDLPAPTRDQHPAGFEEFALGEGVEAVGAEEPDASQADDPPPTLERVNPVFVDSDSDHTDALLRDLAALAGEPDGADDDQPIAVIVDHVGGPLIDREALQRAFTDACVLDSTRCPIGVVAQVLGPLESSAVPLQVHLTVIDDDGLRCDFGEPAPFDLPLLVTTTHPADLTVTYRLPPDDFGQVLSSTLSATAPTGSERALWEDRVDRDAVAAEWPQGWVQQCLVLPALLADQVLYTVEVHAVDAFGASAQATASLQPPAFSDRPLPRVMYRSDNRMALAVPLEDDEHGFVWPIEVGRFPDTECADIEAERLQGLRVPDNAHPDPLIARALMLAFREPRVDPAGDRLAVFDLPYREGRRYIVCAWVYRLGSRSFDTIDITNRYRYEVYTPNRYRVHVTLGETNVASVTPGTRVRISASGCPEPTARTTFQLDGPGQYPLGIPLCSSDGAEMPRSLALGLRYTLGDVDFFGAFGTIPIDTTEGCDTGVHEPGCAFRSRMEVFDFFLPITPGCDLCHVDGWIRVRVDYAASTGQGAGSWVVGLEGTFPSAPDAGPGPPRLDTTSLYLAPLYDGVGEIIDVAFDTNRPTTARLRLTPYVAPQGCSATSLTSSHLGSRHNVRFRDLCPDVFYTLDVTLTDEDGVSASYDDHRWYTRTRARQLSSFAIRVTHITTDPIAAAERCAAMNQVTDRTQGADLDSTCWTGVGYGWLGERAQWYATSAGGSSTRASKCIDQTDQLNGWVEHRPGASLTVWVTVFLFLRPDCGAPQPLSSIPQQSRQAAQELERSLATYGILQASFQVPTGEWEPAQSVILGHIVVGGLDFVVEGSLTPIQEGPFG